MDNFSKSNKWCQNKYENACFQQFDPLWLYSMGEYHQTYYVITNEEFVFFYSGYCVHGD